MALTTKICTASGVCMECKGTLDDVFKAINDKSVGAGFLCCGGNCIRITDISTIQTVEVRAPEDDDDDDDDGRPLVRGFEVGVAGSRHSGDER